MKDTSRVGERGQAVIPKSIRDAAGIGPGDVLRFHLEDGRIVAEKVREGSFVDAMLSLVPVKTKEPKRIDWDAIYHERFGKGRG